MASFILKGVGSTNIGPDSLYLWLLFPEIGMGTLPKTEPTCEDSVNLEGRSAKRHD